MSLTTEATKPIIGRISSASSMASAAQKCAAQKCAAQAAEVAIVI